MSRVSRARTLGSILLSSVAIIGFVHEAQAQIDEIVVTTRKRAENLQEVPIVVTAFTAASIERKGIEELADVAKYTNGLILDEGFSRTDTRITYIPAEAARPVEVLPFQVTSTGPWLSPTSAARLWI